MPTNEAGLVAQIGKRIHKDYPDSWVMKVHGGPFQMAGVPDLLVCVDGYLIGLEVKFVRPGESSDHARLRATAQQRHQIRSINRAGGVAGVVVSVEEALALIERARSREKENERA
jgi:hypothetical protein